MVKITSHQVPTPPSKKIPLHHNISSWSENVIIMQLFWDKFQILTSFDTLGGYGFVYIVQDTSSSKEYALKVIDFFSNRFSESEVSGVS